MAKLSRSLLTIAVLLAAGGTAAYLTRDRWREQAPPWLQALLPPAQTGGDHAADSAGRRPNAGGGRRGGRRGSFDSGPIPVLTSDASTADVPVTLYGVGTVKAYNTVTITAQITGQIVDLPFKEGQEMKKGEVIARIDDSTYRASLDQAIAKRAQDQALLDNARRDLVRYKGLVATNSVTKQTADTQAATVAQDEAQVKSDDAAIASARATLAYTVITAPIDGRTGIRNVDIGNVVQANSTTGIVTLTQMKPISVLFNVPQQSLPDIMAGNAGGPLQVEALSGDNKTVIDTGVLDVINNEVDSSTGTIQLKASFPNETEALWPGAFVNARLLVRTLKGVVVVPTAAVQRGPNGTFLYVLDKESTARMRPITVSQQDDERAVISDGLKAGEKVVTTGFARLSDGAKVQVTTGGSEDVPAVGTGIAPGAASQTGSSGRPAADAGATKPAGGDQSESVGGTRRPKGERHRPDGSAQGTGNNAPATP